GEAHETADLRSVKRAEHVAKRRFGKPTRDPHAPVLRSADAVGQVTGFGLQLGAPTTTLALASARTGRQPASPHTTARAKTRSSPDPSPVAASASANSAFVSSFWLASPAEMRVRRGGAKGGAERTITSPQRILPMTGRARTEQWTLPGPGTGSHF